MRLSELIGELLRKRVLDRASQVSVLLLGFLWRHSNPSKQHLEHLLSFLCPELELCANIARVIDAVIE
jgi:hypothetical protein